MANDDYILGLSFVEFEDLALKLGLTGLILFMVFIIWNLGKESKAGCYGMMWLFLGPGVGFTVYRQGHHPEAARHRIRKTQAMGITAARRRRRHHPGQRLFSDGKCVSHSVQFADGKEIRGVILPALLTFNTGAPEIMEGVAVRCVRLKGQAD